MSTRIKVFNYVMTADPQEAAKTLDEARSLLASRRAVQVVTKNSKGKVRADGKDPKKVAAGKKAAAAIAAKKAAAAKPVDAAATL